MMARLWMLGVFIGAVLLAPPLQPAAARTAADRQAPPAETAAGQRPPDQSSAPTGTEWPPSDHARIVEDMERYLTRVKPLLDRYGYAAVFVAVMVEGCGIPAPGQTLLMAASLAAAGGQLNLAALLLVATMAALVGNSLGYLLGRWGGRPLLHRFRVNEQRLQRVESLFSRRGGGLIIISRFLDGLRQLNGIVAGILQMPWWLFSLYNFLGAIFWSFFWGLGLFYLDRHFYALHQFFDRFRLWIALPAVVCFVLFIVYLLRGRRSNAAGKTLK